MRLIAELYDIREVVKQGDYCSGIPGSPFISWKGSHYPSREFLLLLYIVPLVRVHDRRSLL